MSEAISRRAAVVGAGLLLGLWAAAPTPALAKPVSFQVPLSGAESVPAVQTDGKGTADLTYNPATRVVTWSITYSGLASPVTMAHFHRGAQGKAGPVVIWLTRKGAAVKSPIRGRRKLTAAQAKQFAAGDWYINVHTKNHPAGAIRGQVKPPQG